MTQPLDLDALQAAAEARNLAGAQLANVAFNWSQQMGYALTSDDCEMLNKLRREWDSATNIIPALFDRLRKAEAAREGWKLVPIEPTEEMHVVAVRTIVRCSGNDDFPPRVWRAMIAAAPASTPTDSAKNDKP